MIIFGNGFVIQGRGFIIAAAGLIGLVLQFTVDDYILLFAQLFRIEANIGSKPQVCDVDDGIVALPGSAAGNSVLCF